MNIVIIIMINISPKKTALHLCLILVATYLTIPVIHLVPSEEKHGNIQK